MFLKLVLQIENKIMTYILNLSTAANNKPTLTQCLELFTEPEVLNPEEAW